MNQDVQKFLRVVGETIMKYDLKPLHHHLGNLLEKLPVEERNIINKRLYADEKITSDTLIISGLLQLRLDAASLMEYGFPTLRVQKCEDNTVEMLREAISLLRLSKFHSKELDTRCTELITTYDEAEMGE